MGIVHLLGGKQAYNPLAVDDNTMAALIARTIFMQRKSLDRIVLDPQLSDLLAILKGARNGFTYGAKIRFPHALVMVFLFRSGTLREKLQIVFKATFQHARNLATFATVYKTVMLLLRSISEEQKESSPHTFLAGLLGGYVVFGRGIQSSVNQQIVIYVFARVVLALARLSVQKGGAIPLEVRDQVTNNAWPVFAALSWAGVMWLYRWHPETIQPSLKSSMKYMYDTTLFPCANLSSLGNPAETKQICRFEPLGFIQNPVATKQIDAIYLQVFLARYSRDFSFSLWSLLWTCYLEVCEKAHWYAFIVALLKLYKMPTLKQLTCNVQWSKSGPGVTLEEYGTIYGDGVVETYIPIPPLSTPFSIRLQSDGYIAPGLSMFVYIDGEYQCNRGRNNLKIPSKDIKKHHTDINFVVRQKEKFMEDGEFIGSQWMFAKPNAASNQPQATLGTDAPESEYMGTIEVVVLRCEATTRQKAPEPSVSEKHPRALNVPVYPPARDLSSLDLRHRGRPNPPGSEFTDFGALFDEGTLYNGSHTGAMPFGGDAGWDDNNAGNGWGGGYQSGNQRQNTIKQQDGGSQAPSGGSVGPSNGAPTIVINVNHGNGPPLGGSPAGSWGSSIVPPAQSSRMRLAGQDSGGQGQQNWQSGTQGGQGNGHDNQPANNSGFQNNEPNQSGWNHDNTNNDNAGWENQGGDTSNWQNDNQNNDGWNENDNNANQQDMGWDNNDNGGNDYQNTGNNDQGQSGGDSGNNQGNTWDSGNNNGNDGGWNDDQNNNAQQPAWDNSGNDITGGWDNNQNNDQSGNDNWANQDQGNWNNQDTSGNGWGNADAGANDTKPSNGQDWNTSGNNEGGWNQAENGNNAAPSIAGGVDPSKFGYGDPSIGQGQSARSMPGAFPGGPPHTPGFSGPRVSVKPYYVVLDAVGNPVVPQYPAPAPPPPPPVESAADSKHVQRGKPAVYHHKVAKPKYMDTHDNPYAVFVFKYRTREVLEQMLNITIPVSEAAQKAALTSLSKEELIDQILKSKSKLGSKATASGLSSIPSAPPSVQGNPNGGTSNAGPNAAPSAGPLPSSNVFGAALNNKLEALKSESRRSSSSSSNGNNNNNQTWNMAPPGSPTRNNGGGHPGSPTAWNGNGNNYEARGWPVAGSQRGSGGGPIASWLSQTPVGRKVSGHEPWSGTGAGSVDNNGGGSNQGGNAGNQAWGPGTGNQGWKQNNGGGQPGGWSGDNGGNTGGYGQNGNYGGQASNNGNGNGGTEVDGGW
ncbi:MAG: hypothetical protein Q9174_001986 [Haloplaca sp. 1 TL-2023]